MVFLNQWSDSLLSRPQVDLAFLAATGRRRHTHVDFLWITRRFQTIAAFPINSERLDAGVFTVMLPATKRRSRTCATRATNVVVEGKHWT